MSIHAMFCFPSCMSIHASAHQDAFNRFSWHASVCRGAAYFTNRHTLELLLGLLTPTQRHQGLLCIVLTLQLCGRFVALLLLFGLLEYQVHRCQLLQAHNQIDQSSYPTVTAVASIGMVELLLGCADL